MDKLERAYQPTSINANGQQFVRVQEFSWDENGIKINAKNGFVEVKPGMGDAVAIKLQKGELHAVFGQFLRQQGLHQVTVIDPKAAIPTAPETSDAQRAAAGTLATS